MRGDRPATRNTIIVLLLAALAAAIYLFSIKFAYPLFQSTRLVDPLAEIHSLPVLYYIAIAMIAVACFLCFIYHVQNKGIHLLFLILLAIMLWYTPYYLAGFVYQPDGPWHVGVALHIPEVLAGQPIAFSEYAQDFPSSFIFHYSSINILGIKPLGYISRIFPLLCLCLFVLLCYVFVSRLFNPTVALLSLLLAIPGLHYMHLHPSPHAIGSLLILTALVLLLRKDTPSIVLMSLMIVAIVVCHPISPLILLVFLGAALIASLSRRIGATQAVIASMVVACFVGWFFWPLVSLVPGQVATVPGQVATIVGSISPGELRTTEQYLFGTPFIYPHIYNLNKGIYILYAVVAMILLLYILVAIYLRGRNTKKWASKLGGLSRSQIFLAMSLPLFLILTFLLAEKAHDLIERGLTFIVLAVSCLIASVVINPHHFKLSKKLLKPPVLMLVLFLTLSFPVVAYSIDAYTSFPESEEAGLKFLAMDIPLDKKTIAMNSAVQLSLYLQSPLNQNEFVHLPTATAPDLSEMQPDLIIFRSTGYYYAAMRYDLSFENNYYTEYLAIVKSNKYDKIYSSPTFEVYSTNRTDQ